MVRVGAVLVGVLTVMLVATPGAASAVDDTERRELQRRVDAVVAAGATSATIEITEGRKRVRATSGRAEIGSNRPVPREARFRVGSESKTFLATVVLQLVAERRLGLDDTVESRLPGVLEHGDQITVRQLLSHSSGLFEVLATLPSPRSEEFLKLRWRTWTTAELVARVAAKPLVFEPGTKTRYSNTNYLVLGMLVERLTGNSYAHEIERRIIRPLKLHGTSSPGTDLVIHGPHARGYLPIERDGTVEMVDITELNPSIMNAAGDIISTTRDLNPLVRGAVRRPVTARPPARRDADPGPGLQVRIGCPPSVTAMRGRVGQGRRRSGLLELDVHGTTGRPADHRVGDVGYG